MFYEEKRIMLFSGHYGSGKTNLACNIAKEMRKNFPKVMIADLDIVNPYFRTEDSKDELEEAGIRLICSPYANSNVDVPALPQEMYAIVDDPTYHAVIDVGGDERGALALGRISDRIKAENSYEMVLVANCYRPLTRTPEDTIEVMREIEYACKIPFTGIVNCSNLGAETTAETVISSMEYAKALSHATGIPLYGTAVEEHLLQELEGKIENLIPLRLQKKPI